MRYDCNPGVFHFGSPHGGGIFRPRGKLHRVGIEGLSGELAAQSWHSKSRLSARLIVGFNVGDTPTWEIEDLIPIVQTVRAAQVGNPSATFLAQKGIYQHRDPRQGLVVEDGAQIIVIDTQNLDRDTFQAHMEELAVEIARQFQQEEVILEIQYRGISEDVYGISAD